MIKRVVTIFVSFFAASVFASSCPGAASTDAVNFCASFKTAATCYCTASGLPGSMCQDMNALYNRMIIIFGSLQKACEFQKHTTTQVCMDNWNCYRNGGTDSKGRACSSTRMPCS